VVVSLFVPISLLEDRNSSGPPPYSIDAVSDSIVKPEFTRITPACSMPPMSLEGGVSGVHPGPRMIPLALLLATLVSGVDGGRYARL
jgi:hypothetical protein